MKSVGIALPGGHADWGHRFTLGKWGRHGYGRSVNGGAWAPFPYHGYMSGAEACRAVRIDAGHADEVVDMMLRAGWRDHFFVTGEGEYDYYASLFPPASEVERIGIVAHSPIDPAPAHVHARGEGLHTVVARIGMRGDEKKLFAYCFGGCPSARVVQALRGSQ